MKRIMPDLGLFTFGWALSLVLLMTACAKSDKRDQKEAPVKETAPVNQNEGQTASEFKAEEGWVRLFDGKSLAGWKTYLKDSISPQWKVEDGVLFYDPDPDQAHGLDNLITEEQYGSFWLSFEWKIEADGNSGVFYHVLEDEKYVVPYLTAPEVQLRDYSGTPDFDDKLQMSGAIFGLVGPKEDRAKPAGEWNKVLLKVDVEHQKGSVTLNDELLFEYPVAGPDWEAMIKGTKFETWEAFGKQQKGHIGLQDHAHRIWFREIWIKAL